MFTSTASQINSTFLTFSNCYQHPCKKNKKKTYEDSPMLFLSADLKCKADGATTVVAQKLMFPLALSLTAVFSRNLYLKVFLFSIFRGILLPSL